MKNNPSPENLTLNRVLVIAYYFPPMALSGVQRVSKFVKYLPQFGWAPTVLTAEAGAYFAFDSSLLGELEERQIEICRTSSMDPTRLFRGGRSIGTPADPSKEYMSRLSQFLFVPDNKIGWRKYGVQAGRSLLEEGDFDLIFSSAPPYTCHLIGQELSDYSGLPLITDFRDDWVGNPRHRYFTPLHLGAHERMERRVISCSSHITTINRKIKESLIQRNLGADGYRRVTVIPHGFDPEDFPPNAPPGRSSKFRFAYSGVFYDAQMPDYFLAGLWKYLQREPEMRARIEARFVGFVPAGMPALVEELGLQDLVSVTGYISHDESVVEIRHADALWMTVGHQKGAAGISTSKLFEYMGTRKPILGLVPDGVARLALEKYGAAHIVPPTDTDAIAEAIARLVQAWQSDSLPVPDEEFVNQHDRRYLTGEMARIFHDIRPH